MRICVICGKEFIGVGVQKTCSPSCSKELERTYAKEHYDSSIGNRTKDCVICSTLFEQRNGKITCSEECKVKRNKLIKKKYYKKSTKR